MSLGCIALVGSGEYLPVMAKFEKELLNKGPSNRYIQIPTAAGRESQNRLQYWQSLGADQAASIGAEQVFLPIFNREDAMREDLAAQIDGAGLIYLSGGDPHYLAETLAGSPVLEAIERNWRAGTSLAGCSAGAMAMGPDIPNFRKMKELGSNGFGFVPHIRTIPHYNKFFGWIPDQAVPLFLKAPPHVTVIGIDEEAAIWSDDLENWSVIGTRSAHLLTGDFKGEFESGSHFQLRP
jgi:cyanophycinase